MAVKLSLEGIYAKGYGTIPKSVMQATNLSIEAKAIYAYLMSYTGAGTVAFPSVSKILQDLKISKDRFYRHIKALIVNGYIIKRQTVAKKDHKFKRNQYVIVQNPCPCFAYTGNKANNNNNRTTKPKNQKVYHLDFLKNNQYTADGSPLRTKFRQG